MIEELFNGRKDRTVELNGSRYLVFPLNEISFRGLPNESPGDISHARADGLAILEDTQVKVFLVYVNLMGLDGIDKGVIPVDCLYPNPQRVTGVRHTKIASGWENGPSFYAQGANNSDLSIHCRSERNYEKVQAESYVERLLEIKREAVRKILIGK